MRPKYRLFRRGHVYWCQDNDTGRQQSLRTKDRLLAERLLHARNEAQQQPLINLQIARAYLLASDPRIGVRNGACGATLLLLLFEKINQAQLGGGPDSVSRLWRMILPATLVLP